MSIRQYIPVKAAVLPDPATYCPPFGYDLPVDPNVLQPDPTWYPTGDPVTDEIILTVSDNGDRRIAFYTTMDTGGSSLVQVYGVGGILIDSQTKASSATYSWQLPDGGGVAGVGQTTFKIRITSATSGKHIIGFKTTTFPVSNPISNWQILYAKFNTPNITTLTGAFTGIDVLQGVQFFSTLNSLSLLSTAFYNCISLKSIEFPALPAATTLSQAFYGCVGLTSCKFVSLPLLTTAASCFYGCTILPSQVWPSNMPELLDFSSVHYNNIKLTSITLFATAAKVTTMANCFYGCNSILSITMPASLPALTNLTSTFSACRMLTTINFCTSCPALSLCTNMCYGDQSLKSFTFPATQSALTKLDYTFGWCYAIKTVTYPTSAPEVTTMYQTCCQCYELTTVTLPSALTKVTTLYQAFQNCYQLPSIVYPAIMDACLTAYACHFYNNKLTSITMPTSMNACTTLGQFLQVNASTTLTSFTFPASMNACLSLNASLSGCNGMTSITLPTALPVVNDLSSMNASLVLSYLSVCTFPATLVNAGSIVYAKLLTSFNQPTLRCSQLSLYGGGVLTGNLCTSVNIDWANSTWLGSTLPLALQWLNLSAATLNAIFTTLPTVTGRTIVITGCAGAATCTKTIATAKGWTVTG